MAKKDDILERLTQAPTDGIPRRVEVADPRAAEGLVETRVSRKVVRRRRADEGPEEVVAEPVATTVRRRRPITADEPAQAAPEVIAEAPKAEKPAPAPAPAPTPVVAEVAPAPKPEPTPEP